jgi:hypothetical protein
MQTIIDFLKIIAVLGIIAAVGYYWFTEGPYLLTRGVRIVALLHCGKTLRVKETTPCFPQSHFLH